MSIDVLAGDKKIGFKNVPDKRKWLIIEFGEVCYFAAIYLTVAWDYFC